MPENKNDIFNSIRLERNISYPFPAIVSIISIFIVIASYSILGLGRYTMDIYLPSGWNSTAVSEELVDSVNSVSSIAMTTPIFVCLFVVMLLAPLLIAFNLAQGYSNGQIRTLLSYPVRRRTLILSKSGLVILLMSSSGTIGTLVSLIFFFPFSIELNSILVLITTFWITVFVITSTCTLLAVVSRSARVTAFAGVGLWVVAHSTLSLPSTHSSLLRYLLFPHHIANNHIYPGRPPFQEAISIIDVLVASGSALIFGIVLLILSVFIFKRQEI